MAQSQTCVQLKLLIDSKAHKVLFAEADNNLIDFLFNLLSLPLGTVIRLLKLQQKQLKPMSTISSITLLNKFHIKDVGVLEEKVFNLDVDEGVKLLEASLHSKTVFADVSLGKKVTI